MEERGIRKVKLTSEMKNSFMQYAMSVIVSRALPDVRDGLKPVQRRIIYGIGYEGGDRTERWQRAKKAAKAVMDLGIYHLYGENGALRQTLWY